MVSDSLDFSKCVNYVVDCGQDSDLARLHSQFGDQIPNGAKSRMGKAYTDYILNIKSLESDGAFPYGMLEGKPASLTVTAIVLSQLYELKFGDTALINRSVSWLIDHQDERGWWLETKLVRDLMPKWEGGENTSVKIYHTALITGILSLFDSYLEDDLRMKVDDTLNRALDFLTRMRTENGSLIGFPQSSWVLTPAIARKYGVQSNQFSLHWSVLNNFLETKIPAISIIWIADGLIKSGIHRQDPLISRCTKRLAGLMFTNSGHQGWLGGDNNPSVSTTISAMNIMVY